MTTRDTDSSSPLPSLVLQGITARHQFDKARTNAFQEWLDQGADCDMTEDALLDVKDLWAFSKALVALCEQQQSSKDSWRRRSEVLQASFVACLAERDAAEAKFRHWAGTDVPSLNIALSNAREEIARLAAQVAQQDYRIKELTSQWSVMARACGNWREFDEGPLSAETVERRRLIAQGEYEVATRAILERAELVAQVAQQATEIESSDRVGKAMGQVSQGYLTTIAEQKRQIIQLTAQVEAHQQEIEKLKAATPRRQPRPGFDCATCGHHHQDERLGFICIGCPCLASPPRASSGRPEQAKP